MDIDLDVFDKLGKDSLIKHLSMVDVSFILSFFREEFYHFKLKQKGLKYIIADSDIIRIIDRVISFSEIKVKSKTFCSIQLIRNYLLKTEIWR